MGGYNNMSEIIVTNANFVTALASAERDDDGTLVFMKPPQFTILSGTEMYAYNRFCEIPSVGDIFDNHTVDAVYNKN